MKGEIGILDYLYLLLRRWKFLVLNFVGVCALAAVISLLLPSWYTGRATILPPKEKEKLGLAGALAELPVPKLRLGEKGTPADIYIGVLKSRRIAEALVDSFDLMRVYKVKSKEKAIRILKARTKIERTDEGLISVSVTDRSRERCAALANAYIEFLDRINLDISRRWQEDRYRYLLAQKREAQDSLRAAQLALRSFQERHGVVSLEHQAQAVIKAAAELQMDIMGLELKLKSYQASMGPTHPEVELLKNRIRIRREQLERLRRGELPRYAQSEGIPEDPEVENLFLPIKSIPELQMEYFQRQMAVKIWGAMVEFLSQKLEETRLEMEKSFAAVSTVSWVDRATPPELRSKPKRRLIVMFAGMFSLIVSFFWILGVEYVHAVREAGGEKAEKLERILEIFRRKRS
ncbi:MAG: hypothetical protein DRP95_03145 [Candidatus Latescibacterota bacterium]|nr:MAG: hypothetical protein DRP95_03145 [Candidatus Latescibacterota bacterium]